MSQPDTKQRILDAAESLFARKGFHGTSLRAITTEAETNLASVNYHFGSKDALLAAVLERRLIPLNEVRRMRMEEVIRTARNKGRTPAVRDLLEAFIAPTLKFLHSTSSSRNFIALVGRSFSDPDDTVRKTFLRLMAPMLTFVFESFQETLPLLNSRTLLWRLHFMFGTFAHAMQICSGIMRSPESMHPEECDMNTVMEMIVPFLAAGMEAP